MKRSLIFMCLSLVLVAAGCKKEMVVPNRTIITTLNSGSWVPNDGGRTYTAAIDMPEIDDYFNERGGVLVYISFDNGTYEQVPQVYNGISYSYITRTGQIVMEIQSSDGIGTVTPPGAVRVKIVLIDSV
ncbi:MAG: hypothetical protein ACO1NS_09485 [Daejeonella sp.]|uniref:hypothetical protein n=1 Tax=Daejeonella sp. JGW-45 TaxID=3034148 RepID=UPI0023EA790B|nr:hypothetical protein [Daejeonella sp. JGW-45]